MSNNIVSLQPVIEKKKQEDFVDDAELVALKKETDDWLFSLMDLFIIDLNDDKPKTQN